MHDIDPRQVITEILNTVPVEESRGTGADRRGASAGDSTRGWYCQTWRRQPGPPLDPGASSRDPAPPVPVVAVVLLIAAFSSGLPFLFYVVYLGLLAIGGSYVLTRYGLADLEAGYRVDHRQGHVGDDLRTTYSISNASGLPKPWLEVYNPTDLPVPMPGRALGLRSWAQRSWIAIVPLTRRGTYRIEPMVVRTGDPFGFFEAAATVGRPTVVTVFPRVVPLPRWRLPNSNLEGNHSAPERTLQTTPLATTVRPYAPGDSFNRIHWRSTARTGEIQVKEFDLEQTADVWLFVDLESPYRPAKVTNRPWRRRSEWLRPSPTTRFWKTGRSASRRAATAS
jgi:uncharacterized protein (DUF58 family)